MSTPGVRSGSPRIEGTRLTCANVVLDLTVGRMSHTQFLKIYEELTLQDIKVCVDYCSRQQCIADQPKTFCQGCSLDTRPEDDPDAYANTVQDALSHIREHGGQIQVGGAYDDADRDVWKLAADIEIRIM